MRLRNKIALLCVAMVLFSTGLSGYLQNRYTTGVTRNTSTVHSTELMAQVGNYLDEKLKGIITRLYVLRSDDTFNQALSGYLLTNEPQNYARALSYFSNVFAEQRFSEPLVSSILLYTPKGMFYDLLLPTDYSKDFKQSELYRQIGARHESSLYWLPLMKGEFYREPQEVIPLVMKFSIPGYSEDLLLVINLNERMILNYMQNAQSEAGYSTLIVDQTGELIASDNSPAVESYRSQARPWSAMAAQEAGHERSMLTGRENYLINYRSTNVAPWVMVHIQSEKALLEKLRSMNVYLLWVIVVCASLSVAVAFLMSSNLSRPLSRLEKTMHRVRLGNLDVRVDDRSEDEVGKLGRTFNFMVEQLQEQMKQMNLYIAELQEEKDRVHTEQQLKRRAELKALQSQMSPHFLYNTLDSIKWMAEKNDQTEISRIVTALATFFRTAISRGKEFIPVREEIEHIRSYLIIQQMRYGQLFSYEIDVDAELKEALTAKLLLQPLVENAIYHGIKPLEGGGMIRIGAKRGAQGDILLTVEDNGAGIHPVKLQLIRKRLLENRSRTADGYGLYNVNDRIKLYLGEEYGLSIASEPGKGTKLTARLRAISREEIEHV